MHRKKQDTKPTTHQNLDIIRRFPEVFLDLLLRHETNSARPPRRRVVQHIVHPKPRWEPLDEIVQLLLEQNVLDIHVGVDQVQPCLVRGIFEHGADDLQHGRYSGSARNHAQFATELGGVLELASGSFDLDFVAYLQEADVFRDVAELVGLRVVYWKHAW
jgi:hypothetical protein